MAANKSQGSFYSLFLVAATVLCAGFYYFDSGMGKLLLIVGAAGLLGSLFGMLRIKSLEGTTAMKPGPTAMKLVGAALSIWDGSSPFWHAPDSKHQRTHRSRTGRNCSKSVRDHRRFAGGLQ